MIGVLVAAAVMEDQPITLDPAPPDEFFYLAFDAGTRAYVKQAAVWAKVCALCAFAGYGIGLLAAFFARRGGAADTQGRFGALLRVGNIVVVLLTTGLGVLLNYFLYRFAAATVRGMDSISD